MNQIPKTQLRLLGLGLFSLGSLYCLDRCRFTVEPGQVAIKFSRLTGLMSEQYKEGWHLRIPYLERPIPFSIQTRPKIVKAQTANRDMQNVILTVRVLFRPKVDKLPEIYRQLGLDYEEKVLPSIVNEIIRTVIAQYTASQLTSQRDQVSQKISRSLSERAGLFNIVIDDVSIVDLTFGKEFQDAIEAKQVAQQDAERAKYKVQQAKQEKLSIIIKAQQEAKSIELVGQAAIDNPSYIDIKKIDYQKDIATILADSRNHIMLNSDILSMNPTKSYDDKRSDKKQKI